MNFEFSPLTVGTIMLIAIVSTSISEFLSWILLYRKEEFKINKSEVEKLNKKLQKLKGQHVAQARDKSHQKKIVTAEAQLKTLSQQMTFQSMKSNLLIGLIMIVVINLLGTHFQGIVVAILPFEPFSLIQGITHRNLQGNDYTQCSYLFIYILFAFIWRTNLKTILGFQPPKPAVSFFDPPKFKSQ